MNKTNETNQTNEQKAPTIWTIGHSTRSMEELLTLLDRYGIRHLADVRAFPGSRRYPHFHRTSLEVSVPAAGLGYSHRPELGGRRSTTPDSINTGWRNAGFRGYADYMQTEPFWTALDRLIETADTQQTAIMCAEAVPWRCHRSLIADALTIRGWTVRHILSETKASPHDLTPFARVEEGRIRYPAPAEAQRKLY